MKTINVFIIFIVSILIVSSRCNCPDSYLFEADSIPGWVQQDYDLYNVNSMQFLNYSGDTLTLMV